MIEDLKSCTELEIFFEGQIVKLEELLIESAQLVGRHWGDEKVLNRINNPKKGDFVYELGILCHGILASDTENIIESEGEIMDWGYDCVFKAFVTQKIINELYPKNLR